MNRGPVSLDNLDSLFFAAPCGVAVWDKETRALIYFNELFLDMTGYPEEKLKALLDGDRGRLLFPEDEGAESANEEAFSHDGTIAVPEFRVVRGDGEVIWVRLSAVDITVEGRLCVITFFENTSVEKAKTNQMKLVADNIGSSIFVMRIKDGIESLIYANRTFFELIGVDRAEFEKNPRSYGELFTTKSDRERTLEAVMTSMRTGMPQELEYRFLKRNAPPLWMKRRLTVVKQAEEDSYLMVSLVTDISNQKRAALAAAVEQRRFQFVVEEMNAAVFEWNHRTGEFYSSDSYKDYAMSAVPPEMVIANEGPLENIHPDDVPTVMRFFAEIRDGASRAEGTLRLKLTVGGYRWCRMVGLINRDKNGVPTRTLGILLDISEEKEQSVMLDHLLNNLPGGVAIFKISEKIECQYFSHGFTRLSGSTREELETYASEGRLFESLVYPPDLPRCLEKIRTLAAQSQPISFTFRALKKDGSIRWLASSASVIRYENGCPVYYCVFTAPPDETALYQRIVDDAVTGEFVAERQFRVILHMNASMKRIYDIPEEKDVVGKSIFSITSESSLLLTKEEVASLSSEHFAEFHKLYGNGRYYSVRAKALDWNGTDAYIAYVLDETQEYEKRAQQEEMLNCVPIGIGLHTIVNGVPIGGYMNDNFYNMVGESREQRLREMNGDVWHFNHPKDIPELKALARRLAEGSQRESIIHRVRCGDGEYRWFRLNLSVAHREGGVITVYSSYEDFDETVKTRVELEKANKTLKKQYESEQAQRRLLEGNSMIVLLLDLTNDRLVRYVKTHEFAAMYPSGMSGSELSEKLQSRMPVEEDKPLAANFYDRGQSLSLFRRGIKERHVEFRIRQKDGRVHWLKHIGKMARESNGNVIELVFINDVSKERENEAAIQSVMDEETDFLMLVNLNTETSRLLRLNGKRTLSQRKVGDEFPYSTVIEGRDLGSVIPECRDEVKDFVELDNLKRRLEQESLTSITFLRTTGDGLIKRKKLQASYLNEFHDDIVIVSKDITEAFEEEQKIKSGLEAANKAKTEFLARVSHDMRTPLNGILGIAYLASEKDDPLELKKDIQMIESSGQILLSLVNDTLDMSKIESGEMELHPTVCDEENLFDAIFTAIEPSIKKKELTLHTERKGIEWKKMLLDAPRLQQVFLNLFSNAIKFTPAGGDIYWSMECLEENDSFVIDRFTVRDTGIGMNEEFQKRMFEPFSQENRIGTNQAVGTGLGLSIVKKIVELMGGTISVRSEVDKGTEFCVVLRLDVVGGESAHSVLEAAPAVELEGRRILLCDDNSLNTLIAEKLLEKVGCTVEAVSDGLQGVERFGASEPGSIDAVLMDIRMPVMDGLEAARAIRELAREDAGTVPIIAMSANAFEEDVATSLTAGMNAHLSKPIIPGIMYETLTKLIKDREAAGK